MKRSTLIRLIAIVLVISMVAAPVSAAGMNAAANESNGLGGLIEIIIEIIRNIFDGWFGQDDSAETAEPAAPADPGTSTEPGAAAPAETAPGTPDAEDTVYEQNQSEGGQNADVDLSATGSTPVTMGNVSMGLNALGTVSNAETKATTENTTESDSDAHTGLTWQQVMNGTYYVDAACTEQVSVVQKGQSDGGYSEVTVTAGELWTNAGGVDAETFYLTSYYHYTSVNGAASEYYPVYIKYYDNTNDYEVAYLVNGKYPMIDAGANHYPTADETVSLYAKAGITGYTLTAGGETLATLDGTDLTTPVGVTLYTPKVEEPEGPTVVYFPVTMYNYDGATINAATDAVDPDGTNVRDGFYFTNGGDEMTIGFGGSADTSAYVDGQYMLQNYFAKDQNGNSWLGFNPDADTMKLNSFAKEDAAVWTLKNVGNGKITLSTVVDGRTYYLDLGAETSSMSTVPVELELVYYRHTTSGIQIKKDNCYLSYTDGTNFCGSTLNIDTVYNGVGFFPVDGDGNVSDTALTVTYISNGKVTSGYERWNWWNKGTGINSNGDLIYTGLVESELVDDQIVFTVPEGGVFDDDDTVKEIYEYVGLPFVLKEYTAKDNAGKLGIYYSFDSDENGTYFEAAPQSGTGPEDGQMHKLHFAEGAPQPMPNGVGVGDNSTNAFLPYNNEWTLLSNGRGQYAKDIDYHFGMRADLPFAMTLNGRIKSTDDESAPITFTFSGDDDVWVFIDGHLVIDLGGIHNRLDATINFAENTITYSEENSQDTDNNTGSYNDPSFKVTQQLFTKDGVTGVIPMSREAFALDPDHEMQVFYLERGKGTSNGRIEFNLPMNDTVIVTKDATQSWSQAAEDADKNNNAPDSDSWGLEPLTAKEQASVNNIPFGFTLYKKLAGSEDFVPVANTSFYLVGRGVEGTVINTTDANGHFYLKNGQSAKFITDLPTEGITYYVVEDQVPDGFVAPDFNFAGKAAYDYEWYDAGETRESGSVPGADASEIPEQIIPMPEWDDENKEWVADTWHVNKSYEVTVKGSVEKQDSIEFICSNFLNAALPNPTAIANEDIIVIDYGLPVQIDPLANDVFRGNEIEIVAWGDQTLTLNEVLDEYGNAVPHGTEGGTSWSGSQTFHSGTVTLNDVTYAEALSADGNITSVTRDTFTYKLTEQLTEVEVIHYIIKVTSSSDVVADDNVVETKTACRYALAKVYICPATVMYYEENFSDLVTYIGNNWVGPVTTDGASDYQEPGVVGDSDNSVYGSDVAYQDDSYDSNGTSYYGDTSGVDSGLGMVSAIRFSYTFTGTGTTFFARTSANTGCMQIKIYEGTDTSGEYMNIYYRDTYWKDENNTNEDQDGTLYNIPVFTEEDLPYGTYTVVCTVAAAGTPTEGNVNGAGNEFYLDGIRIMQPLNGVFYTNDLGEQDWVPEEELEELTAKALDAYETDGESNMETLTLRNKLINEYGFEGDPEAGETEEEWPFAVMTDIDGQIVYASDYESIGPKEEVYLLPGQSISFAIKYWHREGYEMHMGMKAPFGTASVRVGQNTFDLENAADCYFDITGMQASIVTETDEDGNDYYVATYTFTATDSIVSLTNIKVVGNYEFMLVDFENEDVPGDIGGNGDYEFEEEGNE